MNDRIYWLLELAAIRAMPGYHEGMENWMHKAEDYGSGEQLYALDVSLMEAELLLETHEKELEELLFRIRSEPRPVVDIAPQPNEWEFLTSLKQNIALMKRLIDFRDGNIRTDVPERRDEDHPWCCPVVSDLAEFRPEPQYFDIPF